MESKEGCESNKHALQEIENDVEDLREALASSHEEKSRENRGL